MACYRVCHSTSEKINNKKKLLISIEKPCKCRKKKITKKFSCIFTRWNGQKKNSTFYWEFFFSTIQTYCFLDMYGNKKEFYLPWFTGFFYFTSIHFYMGQKKKKTLHWGWQMSTEIYWDDEISYSWKLTAIYESNSDVRLHCVFFSLYDITAAMRVCYIFFIITIIFFFLIIVSWREERKSVWNIFAEEE